MKKQIIRFGAVLIVLLFVSNLVRAQATNPLVDDVVMVMTAVASGADAQPLLDYLAEKYPPCESDVLLKEEETEYAPPDYISELVGYGAGDGIIIYFTLADRDGNPTAADGKMTLAISKKGMTRGHTVHVERERQVNKDDFEIVTVGQGAFSHDALVYSWGRIKYEDFTVPPSWRETLGPPEPGDTGAIGIVFWPTEGPSMDAMADVQF